MEGYIVKIEESSREFTARERIAFKDTTDVTKLDEVTAAGPIEIVPTDYAVLSIHNEKAKDGQNKDYRNFVVVDKSGERFVTGSESFFSSFTEIWREMKECAPDEEFAIKVFRRESKNYKGKSFITCSIV